MPPLTDLPTSVMPSDDHSNNIQEPNSLETCPDYPPDSYWVQIESEVDWFDRNAFMERKGSTKPYSHSNSNSNQTTPNRTSSNSTTPHRSKSVLSILGLPKTPVSRFPDGNPRRNGKPDKSRLFRSRSEPDVKSAALATEPGSPRVSCIGRVRSRKVRRGGRRTGLWGTLRAAFRVGFRGSRAGLVEPEAEPDKLVGPRRLVSGMRSESWSGSRRHGRTRGGV